MRAPIACTLLIAAASLVGCKAETPSPAADAPAAEQAEHAAEKAEHAAEKPGKHTAEPAHAPTPLQLDGDEKWKMDPHTRDALGQIEARLAKGPATADVAGYKALGADLDGQIQGLVRGCTMTGPAHDQLHVWLTSFIPAVGALGQASDAADGAARQKHITALVADARAHFE